MYPIGASMQSPYKKVNDMHQSNDSSFGQMHSSGLSENIRHIRDGFIADTQLQLASLDAENISLKKELFAKDSKLQECLSSIKTFWSPELKKERGLRKDENDKFMQLKESYRQLMEEHHCLKITNQQLKDELSKQTSCSINKDQSDKQENIILQCENEQQSKELYLLKKTLEEMELRIETQKETLNARDQSIEKLLELLQQKHISGASMANDEEYHILQSKILELENVVSDLKVTLTERDRQLYELKNLEIAPDLNKDMQIRNLKDANEELTLELHRYRLGGALPLGVENSEAVEKQIDVYKDHMILLKSRIEQLRLELTRKETDLITSQTKLDVIFKQNSDQQHHIGVIREALSTKEQQILSLQTDNDALRSRLQEKESSLERKNFESEGKTYKKHISDYEVQEHLASKDKKIQALLNKIEHLEQRLSDSRASHGSQHHHGSEDIVRSLERSLRDREKELNRLREQRNKDNKERMDEVDMYSRLNRDLSNKLDVLQQELSDKERIQIEADERVSNTASLLQQKDVKIKAIEKTLAMKIDEFNDVEKRIKRIQDEKILVMKEKQEMSKQVLALEEQVNHYIDELAKTQSQLDKMQDIVKTTEQEKKSFERRINEFELKNVRKETDNNYRNQFMSDSRYRENEMINDSQQLQSILVEREKRINELEAALHESAKLTANREAVLDRHHHITNHVQGKVDDLSMEIEKLQKALVISNKKLSDLSFQLGEKEAKILQLNADRRHQLEEALELKQEALLSAISEKDAHIALLENAGSNSSAVAKDLNKLQQEKDKLMQQLREQNSKRTKLLQAMDAKMGRYPAQKKPQLMSPGVRKPAAPADRDAADEDGVWA